MFPSPIGELHFSILHQLIQSYPTPIQSFRPLSGSYISQSYTHTFMRMQLDKFPSPIGELHFSIGDTVANKTRGLLFPSPIGELHFSIMSLFPMVLLRQNQFPSPIGELHFSITSSFLRSMSFWFPSPIGELHFSIMQYR